MSGGSVKRLQREFKNSQQTPIREFLMYPCEDNMFEWHFTMMGPVDSPYSEGFYHGRILIPTNYPFAPPDVVLITPNGRFELEKRICLSISSYHPENWHPTWGITTVLHALREFMLTPGSNAIGAIDYPTDVKKRMAVQSAEFTCPDCEAEIAQHKATLLDSPLATEADKVKNKDQPLPTPDLKASTPSLEPATPNAATSANPNSMAQDGPTMSDMSPLPAANGTTSPDPPNAVESPASSNTPTPPPVTAAPPSAAVPGPVPMAEPPTVAASPVEEKKETEEVKEEAPPAANEEPVAPPVVAEPLEEPLPEAPVPPPAAAEAPAPAARPAPQRQMQQGGWEINISTTVLDRVLLFLFVVILVLTCKKITVNHSAAIWAGISRAQGAIGF